MDEQEWRREMEERLADLMIEASAMRACLGFMLAEAATADRRRLAALMSEMQGTMAKATRGSDIGRRLTAALQTIEEDAAVFLEARLRRDPPAAGEGSEGPPEGSGGPPPTA